jgi:ERF superfamily
MKEILVKLAKVKQQMDSVKKTANNPFFKSKYADLNSHLEIIEPLLAANGLLLTQPCEITLSGKNVVTSRVYDIETGQSLESSMELLVQGADMQKFGASVTYGRRFTVSALFGMQAEDDDGNTATGKTQNKTETVAIVTNSPPINPAFVPASKMSPVTADVNKPAPSFRRPTKPTVTNSGDDL